MSSSSTASQGKRLDTRAQQRRSRHGRSLAEYPSRHRTRPVTDHTVADFPGTHRRPLVADHEQPHRQGAVRNRRTAGWQKSTRGAVMCGPSCALGSRAASEGIQRCDPIGLDELRDQLGFGRGCQFPILAQRRYRRRVLGQEMANTVALPWRGRGGNKHGLALTFGQPRISGRSRPRWDIGRQSWRYHGGNNSLPASG
jgi:hypothetical protein